jgi:hypothetical protein
MKEKLATIIFIALGIASAILGFYLIREELLFSLAFFIGSISCGISAFHEYSYYTHKNKPVDEKNLPSEMIIGYSVSEIVNSLLGYSVFITLGIFFLTMVGFDYKKYQKTDFALLALAAFFIITYGFKIVKVSRKVVAPPVISISTQGIVLDSAFVMSWDDIEDEKITIKKESYSPYKKGAKYLSLFHQNKKIEEKIDYLDVADYTLEQYLKIYRTRSQQNG